MFDVLKILAGVAMVPISWEEMQCPRTKTKHRRKVAKAQRLLDTASASAS